MSSVERGEWKDIEDCKAHTKKGEEAQETGNAVFSALRGEFGDGDRTPEIVLYRRFSGNHLPDRLKKHGGRLIHVIQTGRERLKESIMDKLLRTVVVISQRYADQARFIGSYGSGHQHAVP